MSLRYCSGCGEAMESESGYKAGGTMFTTTLRAIFWCVNDECPRAGLMAINGYSEKPRKQRKSKAKGDKS